MADEPEYEDRRELFCQMFVPCHTIWYDSGRPELGYTLGRVVLEVWAGEHGYPIHLPRLFGYTHLQGDPGDFSVRTRLFAIAFDEDGEPIDAPLGPDDAHHEFGPWRVELLSVDFVNEYCFPMERVTFPEPGLYGLELLRDEEEGDEATVLFRVHLFARARDEQ